jgi:magnesium-protoporphyrin IX monomethyl ester (oxidative) cyclase
MIDVLLVNPREQGGFFERMPPLGLAYMAANLEKHDYSVNIVDLEVGGNELGPWLEKTKPKYVGISGTTHTRFESFRLAKETKEFDKAVATIYGGVHATFTDIETLECIEDIDYVVRGEGEHTIVSLVNALKNGKDLSKVRGITYRDREGIHRNPPAERIHVLDDLSAPAYHLLEINKYALNMEFIDKRGISTITSRGCLARCSFCSASRMFNHQVTTHSAPRVLDDIELLFDKFGYKGIKIFDSTLTMQQEHVNDLCDEITRRRLNFPWECEIRVGTVDQEMLEKMMLLDWCIGIGLKTKVFFSFGHIGETMEDVERTFEFIDKNVDKITTVASGAGVRIYPGTYLEEYAVKNRFLPEKFKWSLPYDDERLESILQTRCVPILLQPQLGFAELERIALRIYRRRFSGFRGLKRGFTKITDKDKLKKLWQLLKIQFRQVFKKDRSLK